MTDHDFYNALLDGIEKHLQITQEVTDIKGILTQLTEVVRYALLKIDGGCEDDKTNRRTPSEPRAEVNVKGWGVII